MKKFAICLLLLCVVLSAFSACGGNASTPSVTEGNGGQSGSNADIDAKWDAVNFKNDTIYIALSEYEPPAVINAGATHSVKYMQGPDTMTTDAVQNAVYDRNQKVKNTLGLQVQYSYQNYTSDSSLVYKTLQEFVLADLKNSPDIFSGMNYGVIRGGITGMCYNALDQSQTNYLDLSHKNWYLDMMQDNTVDQSKIYLLAGDYFIDQLRYALGVAVNIDLYNDTFASEGGMDSLYNTVKENRWSFDEMMRCADAAYVDRGVMGQEDNEDTFGIVEDQSWTCRTFFTASGLDIFEETENGGYKYIQDISAVHNFVDKLLEMTAHDSFKYSSKQYDPLASFLTGNALFYIDAPVLTLEGTAIQNMSQEVAILPYPKYDPSVEYKALVMDNGNSGCILYNSDKFTECSAFLQLSTELSNNGKGTLMYEYYDVALKYKLSANVGQITMLEYIRDGLSSPRSMLFDNYLARSVGMKQYRYLMDQSLAAGTNTFASDWASQYSAVQTALENLLVTYGTSAE